MKNCRTLLMLVSVAGLAGCNSVQTAYIDSTGKHGRGEITYGVHNMENGKFSITDNGVTCRGAFPDWSDYTVVFPVQCTDGRAGQASMTRPTSTGVSVLAGEGTIQFTDGQTKRFVYGPKGAV